MATDRMYELAFSFKNRKLWKELSDTELFGVLLADGEIGYCSVMGMLGEHPSLGVYIGQSGYAGFCRMLSPAFSPESADAAEILAAQDCLRCSFENGEMLSEQEIREVRTYCRKTKKTLRGKNAFPQFVKYTPGRYPWCFENERDSRRICDALEASLWLGEMMKRFDRDSLGLSRLGENIEKIPLLTREKENWAIRTADLPSAKMDWPAPALENEVLIARMKRMKKTAIWESGSFYLPAPVRDAERAESAPYFPYVLMNVDHDSGQIFQPLIGKAEDPYDLIRELAEQIVADSICPVKILVGDDRAYALLEDLCRRTGIRLSREDRLEAFAEAKEALFRHISGASGLNEGDLDGAEGGSESDAPDAEELDQFLNTLMQMRDEELIKMPHDLVNVILQMTEWGAVPDELVRRLKRLFI